MPRTAHSHTGTDGHGPFKKFLKKDRAVIFDKYQALEFIREITQARYSKPEVIRTLGSPAGKHAVDCCLSIVAEEDPSPREWETLNKIFVLIANKKLWEGLLKHEIEKISSTMFGIDAFWQRLPPVIGTFLRETESISLILCLSECRGILSDSSLSRTVIDQIVSSVIASPFAGSEEKMMMQNVFSTTNRTVSGSIQHLPSQSELLLWRQLHDNDHLDDFRKVSSFPTIGELNLLDYPIEYMYRGWRKDESDLCGKHVDRQFRLLRCDMLATLREELKLWRKSQGKVLHYPAPVVIGADFDEGIGVVVNVAFPLPEKVVQLLRSKFSSSKDQAKVKSSQSKFFDEEGKYILPFNTLIIFANEDKQVLATGVVLKRDTSQMMKDALDTLSSSSVSVSVGLQCDDASLSFLLQHLQSNEHSTLAMQMRAVVFNYEPVLEGLKEILNLPLSQELLEGVTSPSPDHIPIPANVRQMLASSRSQYDALVAALTNRVTLIQGPPGTGKTFLGVQLVRTLVPHSRILCICYTNHALDSFLESLLDAGIPATTILRLGSAAKVSERIKPCLPVNKRTTFDQCQRRSFAHIKNEMESYQNELQACIYPLNTIRNCFLSFKSIHKAIDFVPSLAGIIPRAAFQPITSDNYRNVGMRGKAMEDTDIFDKWKNGQPRPEYVRPHQVWDLSLEQRTQRNKEWFQKYRQQCCERLVSIVSILNSLAANLKSLKDEPRSESFAGATIVACTTSYAAKNRHVLHDTDFDTVLVEEAAEIHESHILVNLKESTKRLIMIGDHKQLRPKLEHYPLRVESDRGIDFDRSMFERLILMGYPYSTLDTQHRMRPEISRYLRGTYPQLRDGDGTLTRENIRGMSRNVAFITHSEPESGGEDSLGLKTLSKTNDFEVEMILSMVKYLLQQGYQKGDIVILTPYLGQLLQLRTAIRQANFQVTVSEQDQKDLLDVGEELDNLSDTLQGGNQSIRVATIDNYQGEESKIILASLVRSNDKGEVGFVKGAERVNVLMSRARDGFYLVGNLDTLCSARSSIWKELLTLMAANGDVVPGFPVHCQHHDKKQFLRSPRDFLDKAPNGGCDALCMEALPTCSRGHHCQQRCHGHAHPNIHRDMKCPEILVETCPRGHTVQRRCSNHKADLCKISMQTRCPSNHIVLHECHVVSASCLSCQKKQKANAKAAREAEQKILSLQQEVEALEIQNDQKAEEARVTRLKQELEMRKMQLRANLAAAERSKSKRQEIDTSSSVRAEEKPLQPPSHPNQRTTATTATSSKPSSTINNATNGASAPIRESSMPVSEMTIDWETMDREALKALAHESKWDALLPLLPVGTRDLDALWRNNEMDQLSREGVLLRLLVAVKQGREDEAAPLQYCWTAYQDSPFARTDHQQEETFEYFALLAKWLHMMIHSRASSESHALVREACTELRNKRELVEHMVKAFPQEWMAELRQAIQAISTAPSSSPQASAAPAAPAAPQQAALKAVADRDHQIALRWEEMKLQLQQTNPSTTGASLSEAMDQLMAMTGLVAIKEQCLSLFDSVQVMKERRETFDDQNLNTRFDGNPGTGKTTVADLLCRILMDLKVLPKEATIFKKTGSELITMGVRGLQQELAAMKGDGGGVVFVDEAYQLNDPAGKAVLDFILGHAERMKGAFGSLVWICAGYKRHMDDLFKLNPGLPQRFPKRFVFDDYTDEEMERIFAGLMKRKPTGGASSSAQSKSASEKRKDEAAAEKKKQEEEQRKQANTISMSSRNNVFDNQPPKVDRWGNRWTWAGNRYVDDYGNVSGLDVSTVGTLSNPVVSNLTIKAYVFDEKRKLWHNKDDPADSLPGYPGKEAPKAAAEAASPNPKPTYLKPFTADAKWVRIAIRRIGRRRGVEGFANAREVRNLFDLARERLNARISRERSTGRNPNIYHFERDDLLGPKATMAAFEQSAAWKELNRMDGLQEVKASVRDLVQLVVTNAQREEDEQPLLDVSLNRVFLGNPGTGKTTVARLYARILKDLGLLSKGDIFLKMASDFVGSALGKSEEITRGILTESMGSVLVIDEAYGLYQDTGSSNEPYREAVINTLVEQVQGKPGEDRAVLLLGYRDEMETMMRKCNPGLSRRFQLDQAFEFKDYDDEALKRILVAAVRKAELTISDATAVFAVKRLSKAKAMPNFGNAGAVDNLLSEAKLRMVRRTTNATGGMGAVTDLFTPASRGNTTELLPADFAPEGYTEEIIEPEALLSRANLLGCTAIRKKLEEYCAVVKFNKAHNQPLSDNVAFNFVFTGAPGTGKTSVARLMGKMFHSLGLLPTDEVMEISASDLMTGYVGQTGKKTREEFTKGRGKVVFVDEAYQLNPEQGGSYTQEAVDEIVKLMTSTDFQNKMIVILAGYKNDMERMLNVNAGLRSRFTEHVNFASFSPNEVYQLLHKLLTDDSQRPTLSPSVTIDKLRDLSMKMTRLPTFANGRDVNTLANKARRRAITRSSGCPATSSVVEEDLDGAFTEVEMASGASTTSAAASSVPERSPQPQAFANSRLTPPPPPQMTTTTLTEATSAVVVDEESESDEDETELTLDEPSTTVEARTTAVSTPPPPPPQLFNSERWNSATPKSFLESLQFALDLAGWSSPEKIRLLCDIPRAEFDTHPEIAMLLAVLKRMLPSLSPDEVYDLLEEWQETQEDVKAAQEEQAREEEQARLMQRETLVPIWRCGVCGRADQPYIVCYVRPYIVRYERRSLS